MASLFPAAPLAPAVGDTPVLLVRERGARAQCHEAFGAVARFEGSRGLQLAGMGPGYLAQVRARGAGAVQAPPLACLRAPQPCLLPPAPHPRLRLTTSPTSTPPLQRTSLVSSLLEAGASLGLPDEVVHDSVLLLDRAMGVAAQGVPPELLPLVAASALRLSALQASGGGAAAACAPGGGGGGGAPGGPAVAAAMGVDAQALGVMEWRVQQLLGGDTLAISTMRCLKVYLERMGYR
jgi:pentatricopeptide repeat domain-containing protein 1